MVWLKWFPNVLIDLNSNFLLLILLSFPYNLNSWLRKEPNWPNKSLPKRFKPGNPPSSKNCLLNQSKKFHISQKWLRSPKTAKKKVPLMNSSKRLIFQMRTLTCTLPHASHKLPLISLILCMKIKETSTTSQTPAIKDKIHSKKSKNNMFKDTINTRNLDLKKSKNKMKRINVKINNLKVNLLSLGAKCKKIRHKLQNTNLSNWRFMNNLKKSQVEII